LIYPPELLDQLQAALSGPFSGVVYRHMFAGYPPFAVNTRGARWNPPDVGAIYTSVERQTAIAEAEHRISLEPFRPRAKRTMYELRVELASALDLTSRDLLLKLGVGDAELEGLDFSACQLVGGAVAWLEHDGLLVPSARCDGTNLVIFPAIQDPEHEWEIVSSEVLEDSHADR
jgi:RES domain-containing protein